MADFVLDIHSGGKTLEIIPFAAAHVLPDQALQDRCVAAMQAFNAPNSIMLLEVDSVGMYDTAAEDQGKVFVSTELGGGGSSTATTAKIAKRGVRNFLIHAGILAGELEVGPTRNLDMPDDRCYTFSESTGLIEYTVELGDTVRDGDVIAYVYDIQRTGTEPTPYYAKRDGIFTGRHFPGLIAMGDVVAMLSVEV